MKLAKIFVLLCATSILQAIDFNESNKQEVIGRWRVLFGEEYQLLDQQYRPHGPAALSREQMLSNVTRFTRSMLAIEDEDVHMAVQIVSRICKGVAWQEFLDKKDLNSVLAYIEEMTAKLRRFISPTSTIAFPPQLQDVSREISVSDLDEELFCTKLRQTFLAFTIVVSLMARMTEAS